MSDKKLKMFLVSTKDPKGSQWWIIHYTAEEAVAYEQANWPDAGPMVAEEVDPSFSFGAPLSLNPDAHKDHVPQTAAEICAAATEPDCFGGAGGDWLCRINIKGESHQFFTIDQDGKDHDGLASTPHMQFAFHNSVLNCAFRKEGESAEKEVDGFSLIEGWVETSGVRINVSHRLTEDKSVGVHYALLQYRRLTDIARDYFYLIGSVYGFRHGFEWQNMTDKEFAAMAAQVREWYHFDKKRIDTFLASVKARLVK